MQEMNSGECFDLHHQRQQTMCNCMTETRDTITDNELKLVMGYLIIYSQLSWKEQRQLVAEWVRYANSSRFVGKKNFLLPGISTIRVCRNAIAKIIGKSKVAWNSIGKEGKEGHGLSNRKSNNRISDEIEAALHDYFFSLQELAAPRATRLVTDLAADKLSVRTELKDTDSDLVELPSCHSKRALYRSFLHSQGWELKFDSKSRCT